MTEEEQDAVIMSVFAERKSHREDEMTARQIRDRSQRRSTPLTLTEVARRLPHLMRKGYAIEIPGKPGVWAATPVGLTWITRIRGG